MLQYWIQVSNCCKVSFNMLQSQFIFYKGSECKSWEDTAFAVGDQVWHPHFCFSFRTCKRSPWGACGGYPHNSVRFICKHVGVFKCRKRHSSWILCHEESAYDLSEQQQDFLSLPPCLSWANSWQARSPPITQAAEPPPLSTDSFRTTYSWLLKHIF